MLGLGMNNSNRFFHWSKSFNLDLDGRNNLDFDGKNKIKNNNQYNNNNNNNLSKIELHKGLVKVEKIKQNFNSNILPYTYNERYFGNFLLGNLRQKYLSALVALLEKNQFSVAPRQKDQIPFPI